MGNDEQATKPKDHKRNGRKKNGNGNNGKRLTFTKREALYRAFAVRQSKAYVAKACGVSTTTVTKYKELDAWDERLARLRRRVQEHEDKKVEVMLKRQVQDAQDIQSLAMVRILEGGFVAEDTALRAFDVGSRIERIAAGEAGDRIEGDLLGELAKRHKARTRRNKASGKGGPSDD